MHTAQADTDEYRRAILTDTWKGYQTTGGFTTISNSLTEVIRFSGIPDRIEIWAKTNDVIVEFDDEQGRPGHQITILAGMYYEPQLRARAVRAQNAVAGFTGQLQVVGKWLTNHVGGCGCQG